MLRYKLVLLSVVCVLLTSCNSLSAMFGFDDPTVVVKAKYDALSRNDQNAYLETIVPESRTQIAMTNGVANVLTAAFIKLDPLDMNYGGWMDQIAGMKMTYSGMQYEVVEQQGEYALIKASGQLVMGAVNFRYCMYQDVSKISGQWYNDELSEKKIERMQPLMQQRMQELQGVAESSGVDPLFGSADVAMLLNPQLWDMMFYFC